MKPEDVLKQTGDYLKELKKMRSMHVVVGLPKDKVGGKIYGEGTTVMAVGAIHEYGGGDVPQRSWLRVPFQVKRDELSEAIAKQAKAVFDGKKTADKALGLIGAVATNISKDAFTTNGYGKWPALKASTINAKGSSKPLLDTGTLRNSITWQVRNG